MSYKPPATLALIGISALVYLLVSHFRLDELARALLISQYTQPALPEIRAGQLWRLITPIFLHFGIFHVVFNLLWIWEFGRIIEARYGTSILLGVGLIIAVVSNLGQYYVDGPNFGGMSGLVYGYFGFVWINGRFNPDFSFRINPAIVNLLLGWFVVGWSGILSFFNLHIANTAHTAGLLSGIALAFFGIVFSRLYFLR